MANEWKRLPFDQAIEVISGGTPKTTVAGYWGGNIPWLSVADFNTGYRWVNATEKSITELGLKESATTLLRTGDIIISARGTVGVVSQLAKPMAFNQSCYGIRGRQDIANNDFIYYALKHIVSSMKQVAHGAVFDTITRDTFKILEINLPPSPEQRAIAYILGTLDDKIELNRQMNNTLEAIARAIFKSWFVDFEPVRAKTEGRWRRGQSLPGLPAHLYDLFPDRFGDSEFGDIPMGWEVKRVGDVLRVAGGSTPSTTEPSYWDRGRYHWATPKDLSSLAAPILLDTERKITEAGLRQISSGLLPAGTVLMSSRAPVGYLAITVVPAAINQGFIAMVCDGPVTNYYVLNWCRFKMEEIKQRASGTTFAEISKAAFRPINMLVPDKRVMDFFTDSMSIFYRAIQSHLEESHTAAAVRDALLPKLLSGEIPVRT